MPRYVRARNTLSDILKGASPDANGCLIWNRYTTKHGYGVAGYACRTYQAHRLVWILTNGPVPDGISVLHKCDVRNCVNVEHLFLGTHQDNYDDMVAKGRRRMLRGIESPTAKLSAEQVIHIRTCDAPTSELVEKYGVHSTTIQRIRARKCYLDVKA